MKTEQELRDQLERESEFAKMGQQVLSNQAYKQFFVLRKAQIFDTFCNTKHAQSDVREEAWRTMVNLLALEKYFKECLETGKMNDTALKLIKED